MTYAINQAASNNAGAMVIVLYIADRGGHITMENLLDQVFTVHIDNRLCKLPDYHEIQRHAINRPRL
jgi:hypothetical protein